ncbi:DUF4870 domain-containing protein [uncultured Aeromicrobium sp.]|uniref:DUF4870 domain-containing protein n=1 Tax=uncultured Aeromicrobium sp. TaxID=337820 RepID=UPI0025F107E9|nr:DUF4870 domain-containing protein [uncultured Aeromicrobium sp.]
MFLPIPFAGSLIASITMLIVGVSQRKLGGLARDNAQRAANWGLTYLLATVALVGSHFGILFALRQINGSFPFGVIIVPWAAVTVLHIVFTLMGLVRASGQRPVRVNGIPFCSSFYPSGLPS